MENNFHEKVLMFYAQNYSPFFSYEQKSTKGGYEVFDVLKHENIKGTFDVIDSCKRCRFCGKTEPNVSFNQRAHLFPESLGNKLFRSVNNECDNCNRVFSEYESDLNTFLFPYLVLGEIHGKKGLKKYCSNDKSSTVQYANGDIEITYTLGKQKIYSKNGNLRYEFDINEYRLSNVYRILLKMALSILPESEFKHFTFVTDNLVKKKLCGYECFIFSFFPGVKRFEFQVIGYKKITDYIQIPSYLFIIMNSIFSLQIPVYSDNDLSELFKKSIKTLNICEEPLPTPFDHHDVFGDKKSQLFKVVDESKTPRSKKHFAINYDKLVHL